MNEAEHHQLQLERQQQEESSYKNNIRSKLFKCCDSWIQVPGASKYWVSKNGDVISCYRKSPIIMKPTSSGKYVGIAYYDDKGQKKRISIHRLVLISWKGMPADNMECAHINGNKNDNRLENLCWVTGKENQFHRIAHGTACFGEKNSMSVLTDSDVKAIRKEREAGVPFYKIAKIFNVSTMTAYRAATGKSWSHLS